MVAVSVVVATIDPGEELPAFVRGVDAQSLPSEDFELVVVDASRDGSADRLRQLARRRPNVSVLTAAAASPESDRIAVGVERASGERVLVIAQSQRLAPRALEVLLERAARTDADVVLGRVAAAGDSGSALLPQDVDRIDVMAEDLRGCVALVRRTLLAERPGADLGAVVAAAGTVSTVGGYACALLGADRPAPDADGTAAAEAAACRWEAGTLHVSVPVRGPDLAAADLRAWLVVTDGAAEIAVPAALDPATGSGTARTASAVLDPRTAAGGHPLDDGSWQLQLRLVHRGGETTLPLAAGPAAAAVVAGRPYVVRAARGGLRIDAGATGSSVVGTVALPAASLAESARGTLVTLDHPALHVHGDAVLQSRLLLDRFGLPARLVCRDGAARTEAYVSSLPGTSDLSIVCGEGAPVRTGLRLRVSGAGRMTLERAPVPKPTPQQAPRRTPVVQRLRRRLPDALDPLARRLSDVPVLRRTYRRLISR